MIWNLLIFTLLSTTAPLFGADPFIVGRLQGQLGNQMFEIATASAVAWDHGVVAYFPDIIPTSLSYQHVFYQCRIKPPNNTISHKYKTTPLGYAPISYQPFMEISGYCQNEKYFLHHRDRLVKLFSPTKEDKKYIQKKYSKLLSRPNTVSVHLRYYYAERPDEECFVQYDREYYEKAMALFPKDSVFLVMSDNPDFAYANIPTEDYEVYFLMEESFYIDFFIQTMCKHNIIANSTFSWWSAWLNQNPNKIVVRPDLWLKDYPDIGGPDNWIRVAAEGMKR